MINGASHGMLADVAICAAWVTRGDLASVDHHWEEEDVEECGKRNKRFWDGGRRRY